MVLNIVGCVRSDFKKPYFNTSYRSQSPTVSQSLSLQWQYNGFCKITLLIKLKEIIYLIYKICNNKNHFAHLK